MLHVFEHSLIDSLKVLGVALIIYIILSFIEDKISKALTKSNKLSPLIGSSVGLIPQCGISVVASDLYLKKHITIGTLLAVFIGCSDEALPILLSRPDKYGFLIALILIKMLAGFILGFTVDLIITKKELKKAEGNDIHIGCCHHEIDNDEENKLHKHLIHPILHSIKIFIYVFVITFLFGLLIHLIGEDNILSFLQTNKYLSPLFSTIIGIIPNCASSVLITELFLLDGINFGALVAGLCMNAGLGLVILLKEKKDIKNTLLIITILFIYSLFIGYITSIIIGF